MLVECKLALQHLLLRLTLGELDLQLRYAVALGHVRRGARLGHWREVLGRNLRLPVVANACELHAEPLDLLALVQVGLL